MGLKYGKRLHEMVPGKALSHSRVILGIRLVALVTSDSFKHGADFGRAKSWRFGDARTASCAHRNAMHGERKMCLSGEHGKYRIALRDMADSMSNKSYK